MMRNVTFPKVSVACKRGATKQCVDKGEKKKERLTGDYYAFVA